MFKIDNSKQKKHITANGKYFISTNRVWDSGWETMVFARNPETGEIDFTGVYRDHYNDEAEAYLGHDETIYFWETKE